MLGAYASMRTRPAALARAQAEVRRMLQEQAMTRVVLGLSSGDPAVALQCLEGCVAIVGLGW